MCVCVGMCGNGGCLRAIGDIHKVPPRSLARSLDLQPHPFPHRTNLKDSVVLLAFLSLSLSFGATYIHASIHNPQFGRPKTLRTLVKHSGNPGGFSGFKDALPRRPFSLTSPFTDFSPVFASPPPNRRFHHRHRTPMKCESVSIGR